jgi:threonylcarbamoyladenosine tRNA methylthiotransferase MtaB
MDRTFSIQTIGCKLNQFESERIRQDLVRGDWEYRRFDEGAAVYIINSCTVTGRSDLRSRGAARRARRVAPDSFVVVTGCYAETQPGRLAGMNEVDLVVGNAEKDRIPDILEGIASGRSPAEARGLAAARRDREEPRPPIDGLLDHARAFVKIQDGCNASCSYCAVPLARGASRSVAPGDVLAQVAALLSAGYREIVLTGVHIGRYGADLLPATTLERLVDLIFDETPLPRLRLGSVEPTEVTPRLVAHARDGGRLAAHFHIPLQSGDDAVLRAMNRPYRTDTFRETIELIAGENPCAAIGTDVIAGFPGETGESFGRTLALVRDLPLAYLHVFGYSPRPGTAAAAMGGRVSAVEKKRRSRALIDLGAAKRRAFEESQIGTEHLALVEGLARREPRFVRALTGNYCEVLVPRRAAAERSLLRIRVARRSNGILYGDVVRRGDDRATGETELG